MIPSPTALFYILVITNLGISRIALMTQAKPLKNFLPASNSTILTNSSKEAPA